MNDDTQPKRPSGLVPPYDPSRGQPPIPVTEDGPGCMLWVIAGFFTALTGILAVVMATLAGWSSGHQIAQVNATATQNQDIQTQCSLIEQALANHTIEYVNVRIASLQVLTPMPACLVNAIPTATALYLTSLPTATAIPTNTPEPTATIQVTLDSTTQTAPLTAPTTSGSTQFDPVPLFTEAQTQISSAQWRAAADTLDAVMAIDPNYQPAVVKQMMFQALTEQAKVIYGSPQGNLAEAILLTTRAEQYGDLSNNNLSFERTVAQLYLDALAVKDMNYPEAIRLFNMVIQYSPNYRNGSGDARQMLVDQYVDYGDRFVLEGKNCDAVPQYEAVLSINVNMQGTDAVRVKRDNAVLACSQGTVATVDPALLGLPTTDPNQPPAPTQQGVAPIGQQ